MFYSSYAETVFVYGLRAYEATTKTAPKSITNVKWIIFRVTFQKELVDWLSLIMLKNPLQTS